MSNKNLIPSCTILSLGLGIVKGLRPALLGFFIYVRLAGVKSNFPFLKVLAVSRNHSNFIPSNVSSFKAGVRLPLLDLMRHQLAIKNWGSDIISVRPSSLFPEFALTFLINSFNLVDS